ncbi:MAG: 4Fe-4S binding protein, partial [Spirochaetales bacterium]|nr:4Fe-4S binding protein [Spirochaetales bacterium]
MSDRRYHSVILDHDACKGCTICVTGCPAEAIRVRDGKAQIIAERCIDCGEC